VVASDRLDEHLCASPVKEVPLLLSMIFAQHKRLMELERNIKEKPKK
jgi:hypothetical protein